MFSQLGDKLQEIFKDLRGHGTISEVNIDAALRQLRLALLEADVDFQVAKEFLARLLKKQGRESVLVACDLQRPAAIEQLATLGKEIEVPVHTPDLNEKNVQRAAAAALESLAFAEPTVGQAIFDTAGRQEIDAALIEELKQLKDFLQPQETLLVVDAATG